MRKFNIGNRLGFTLAETLITLAIVGVVAAIAIPPLMNNVTQNVFASEQDLALKKITEATNQMRTNDVLDATAYATNDAFADEFQKYMKVAKRCDSSHLSECFSPKFKTGSGDNIDVTTLTTGDKMGVANSSSPMVGMVLINGTSVLLSIKDSTKLGVGDTSCDRISPFDNQQNTTSCLSLVYDVNGSAQPNIIGKDINTLNATIVSCVTVGGICVATGDTTIYPVGTIKLGATDFPNQWAGAMKACTDLGMRLPTYTELRNVMYDNYKNGGNTVNMSATYYWSSMEIDAETAREMDFSVNSPADNTKANTSMKARCVK